MKIQPLADRIMVKVLEAKEMTKGGIVLPDTAKEKPQEAVTPRKQYKISRVALDFLQRHRLENWPARFDVVAVDFTSGDGVIALIENAFELAGQP